MISNLKIKNFKSHKDTSFELKNLTILCGANAVGKSSAIQALLLLREAWLNKTDFQYLDLLSNPIKIGTAVDALYQFSENDIISFILTANEQQNEFNFETEVNDFTKTLINESLTQPNVFDIDAIKKLSLFSTNFQYISAARSGPQSFYPKDDVIVEKFMQMSVMEGKAEYCINFLDKYQSRKVIKDLHSKNSRFDDLLSQTIAWEKEISEDVNIIIKDNGKLGYELKFQFETESETGKTNEFSSNNVGFGISYILPVIVSILSSKPDTLLILENPEAHLHPKGQAKIAELICLAAQAGVQIILETHSDHIINGILVQCKKFEEQQKGIDKNNVSIYHIDIDKEKHQSRIQKINIEEDGLIRYTPKGFFDQFTIDRKFLMGF